MSRADTIVLSYEPATGAPRQVRFEPQSDGSYERIERVREGCDWRETGVERVETVTVDAPQRAAGHTIDGP